MTTAATNRPRLAPLRDDECTDKQIELLQGIRPDAANLFRTVVRNPSLFGAWTRFGGRLLYRGELSDRQREIVVLRAAARCTAHYEWKQHVAMALECGLSQAEINTIGGDASGLADTDERGLVTAVDELHDTSTLSDATWQLLRDQFSDSALIEFVLIVGQYHMVAYLTNAFGIQMEGDDGSSNPSAARDES